MTDEVPRAVTFLFLLIVPGLIFMFVLYHVSHAVDLSRSLEGSSVPGNCETDAIHHGSPSLQQSHGRGHWFHGRGTGNDRQ